MALNADLLDDRVADQFLNVLLDNGINLLDTGMN